MLRNKQSRQVLDVSRGSQENNANVVQWPGQGSDNQQWLLEDMGNGYYTLTAKHSGKALNVRAASTLDGAQIEQYEKNGTDAQQWELEETEDGYYILLSKASGMALTVSGNETNNGSPIQQHTNQGSDIQLWRFERYQPEIVIIYSDANYRGISQELEPGRYDYDKLTIGQDSLSSLRVPAKMRVILYEHPGFTGQSKEFTSNTPYVGGDFNHGFYYSNNFDPYYF